MGDYFGELCLVPRAQPYKRSHTVVAKGEGQSLLYLKFSMKGRNFAVERPSFQAWRQKLAEGLNERECVSCTRMKSNEIESNRIEWGESAGLKTIQSAVIGMRARTGPTLALLCRLRPAALLSPAGLTPRNDA